MNSAIVYRRPWHNMHIFLIEIRSCHLGYLGCYGNDWLSTPSLNAVAGAGLVFDSHYADLIGATGGEPAWSALYHNDGPMSLEPMLGDRGVEVLWVGTWPGMAHRSMEITPVLKQLVLRNEACLVAVAVNDLLPPWDVEDTAMAEDGEAHSDGGEAEAVVLDERDTSILQAREAYGARVLAVDQWLGKFLEQLDDKKLLDRAAIIITADQGVSLGEHAPAGTMPARPYEEIRHLPLIIRLPGDERAGSRVSTVTQASDMAGAILGLLGRGHAARSDFDLFSLGRAKELIRDYARTVQLSEKGPRAVAVRTHEWAFLTELDSDSPVGELYCKPDDRWEINDIVQHHPDLVPTLESLARDSVAQ